MSSPLPANQVFNTDELKYPGIYVILFVAKTNSWSKVGRRDNVYITSGYYLYVGSAKGPGGLKSRLEHHLKPPQRPHWHLDYLKNSLDPVEFAVTKPSVDYDECSFAQLINGLNSVHSPDIGIGAADCNCYTHFWYGPGLDETFSLQLIFDDLPLDNSKINTNIDYDFKRYKPAN